MSDLLSKIRQIKLLAMDVDGVLTKGEIGYTEETELKQFNCCDGAGIKWLMRQGFEVAVITGRSGLALERRCRELGIHYVYQNAKQKLGFWETLLTESGLQEKEIAFIGDDLVDLPVLRRCGLAVGPRNAVSEVKLYVDFITTNSGGNGCVREVVDLLLKGQRRWNEHLERYISC